MIESCTIITTDANPLVTEIHDRMPVILSPESYDHWLKADPVPTDALESLLRPYLAEGMEAYPVSRAVNNARNEGPELTTRMNWRSFRSTQRRTMLRQTTIRQR